MYSGTTVAGMRTAEADAIARVGEDTLMQRAAAGLARAVLGELRERTGRVYATRVLVLAGSGNNGGDALFAGARLARRGVRVSAWCTGSSVHAAGLAALLAAGGRELTPVEALVALPRTDLVIDGVAGIGGRAGLSVQVAGFAASCASAGVPVVAVDLPSGLSADPPWDVTAAHIAADVTVTFGAHKLCHVVEPARSACGRIELVDIGLGDVTAEVECWEEADVAAVWPVPGPTDDKYSRGVVALDAGSHRYPGAGVLATTGAVRAGAGMVRFTGAAEVAGAVLARFPNVVVGEGRAQAVVVGSGWGRRTDGRPVVDGAVASGVPVVIDADALTMLPAELHPKVLLTPHAGELAKLLGATREQVQADPIGAVRYAVDRTGATVLLKGATQFVASPGVTPVGVAVPGPAWTAQAGSGDFLAGVCGALLAAGLDARSAALAGASIQAMAAGLAAGPVPPQELRLPLPGV